MIAQGADKVLHLCFDLKKNRLRCCIKNFCNDEPDHCKSPFLKDGWLDKDPIQITGRLKDIDRCLKHSTKQEWESDFERYAVELTEFLFHDKLVKACYEEAASPGGEQFQIIAEQCLPGQVGKYDILSSPLEFWMAEGVFVPLKHPVIRRLRFPGSVSTEEVLKLNGEPLVVLFVEAEKPGASPYSAKDYVEEIEGYLKRGWNNSGYPERNLGIMRLDWARATADNILKVIEGDPQPYFSVLDAEIQRLDLKLKKAREEKEEKEEEKLERDLEERKRFAEKQKPLIEDILRRTPHGLIHWVGPMEYDEVEKRFVALPICPTSENESKELLPRDLVKCIGKAKQRICWQFCFLTSYTVGKEELKPPEASLDFSNLSHLIQQLLVRGHVSSILAFLRPIHRKAAQSLFTTFYISSASNSASLPQALLQARQELHDSHSSTCHYAWAVPVLFQLPEKERVRQPPAPEKGPDRERQAKCQSIRKQIETLNSQRRELEEQIARGGAFPRPELKVQLEELERKINELEEKLRQLECDPDDRRE